MLINDFDIQMASVFKNAHVYKNPKILQEVIDILYCQKTLKYSIKDISVVFEAKKFKKGDIIFELNDSFNRPVKGAITYNNDIKHYVSYLFQEDKFYILPVEVIKCLNPSLSREESMKVLKDAIETLSKSADDNDVQWGIKMDSILAFMEYEDNKEEIMRNEDVIERAQKCIKDYIDRKYFVEHTTKNNMKFHYCLN